MYWYNCNLLYIYLVISSLHKGAVAAEVSYNLTLTPGWKAPDGYWRSVFLVNGEFPGPLIEAAEGDDLVVNVYNMLPVDTTIHWHGLLQKGSPYMDGVPGVNQYPIPAGGNYTYSFSTVSQYGFYWYHSHVRAYYDDAIRGPLFIQPASNRSRPFSRLAANSTQLSTLLAAERSATNLMLNDWTHQTSDEVYSEYFATGAFPFCVDSILVNGAGQVRCLPPEVLASPAIATGAMPKMAVTQNMSSMQEGEMSMMSGMSEMASNASLSPRGCTPVMMFRPGYDASSLNADSCQATNSSLTTLSGEPSSWLALNLVNSGAVSMLTVSIDLHSMHIYAADGYYVDLQEVNVLKMGIGQRYSVLIQLSATPGIFTLRANAVPTGDMQQVIEGIALLNISASTINSTVFTKDVDLQNSSSVHMADLSYPASNNSTSLIGLSYENSWVYINGTAKAHAITLDDTALHPFDNVTSPPLNATITKKFYINQTDVTDWVVEGTPYQEASVPVLFGDTSDGYNANTTYHFTANQTVDIIMQVSSDSMDTMGHPMHLHGHKFWVLGSGSGQFVPADTMTAQHNYHLNLRDPPYRDTAHLPAGGWLVIRYVTDNPGAWILHCHIQWHLVSGMAVVLFEGENNLPRIPIDLTRAP